MANRGHCCLYESSSFLQLLPDGVQVHQAVVQHAGHLPDAAHHLLPAAFLQLPGLLDEVLVHALEEALQRGDRLVCHFCGLHHRRVHHADHLHGPADLPVLRVMLRPRPEEGVAAQSVQALIDKMEDVGDVLQLVLVLLQQNLHLKADSRGQSYRQTEGVCSEWRAPRLTFLRSLLLLTLSEMAADAEVMPPAAATPAPTAVITRLAPKVKGTKTKPVMAAIPPTAVVVPPVMPAILALW